MLPINHFVCYLKGNRFKRPTHLPGKPADRGVRIPPSDESYLQPIVNSDHDYTYIL